MSIHPSLSSSEKDKKARSVLKRTERLRTMQQKGEWKEGDRVYGLPKIKTIRIKIKKEKIKEVAEAAALGVEGAAPAATPETQVETPGKTPTPRGQEKPEKK